MGIRGVRATGLTELARIVADDLRSKDSGSPRRTIIAFRHPSRDDPVVMLHTVASMLPAAARRAGIPFCRPVFPVFLYARGVAVWGGPVIAWLLPRGGAISVYHNQVNRESMDQVFHELETGVQPLTLAPEAQVTYHNYRVSESQRGTAVLAEKARERGREIRIVPVGIEYHYPDHTGRELRRIMKITADALGRSAPEPGAPGVLELADSLIEFLHGDYANRYTRLWRLVCGASLVGTTLQQRTGLLLEVVLRVGERIFDIPRGTNPVERIFSIRRHLYENLFSAGAASGRTGPLAGAKRDVRALDAMLASTHLELADVLAYVDFTYLDGTPGPNRVAEYALILADLTNRAIGHSIGKRPSWKGRHCEVRFGDPIDLPDRNLPFRDRVRETHRTLTGQLAELSRESAPFRTSS